MTSRRSTNFHRGKKGNALQVGEDLTIKIAKKPLYVIGRLFKRTIFGNKLIQIEQTGTIGNPSKDSITFELKERFKGKTLPMKIGKYRVTTYAYFTGEGGKRWKDNFEIE